ncbi:unnamed protein product, partial [Ectocarpus sp. 13 AM-2016]
RGKTVSVVARCAYALLRSACQSRVEAEWRKMLLLNGAELHAIRSAVVFPCFPHFYERSLALFLSSPAKKESNYAAPNEPDDASNCFSSTSFSTAVSSLPSLSLFLSDSVMGTGKGCQM